MTLNPPQNSLSSSSMVTLASSGETVIRGVMGETRLRLAENDSVSSNASSSIIGIEMRAKVSPGVMVNSKSVKDL